MKILNRRSFIITAALLASLTHLRAAEPAGEPSKKIKIVLVGDSTVTDQAGWGGAFPALFKPEVQVVNLAKGGESSKSYRDNKRWAAALAEKGDYMFIQFGHNDQPGKGPNRETSPESTYPENLARFVDEARAAGAKPILVTSIVRRVFDRGTTKLRNDLEPYAAAVRKVAKEKDVPVIDLHARTHAQIEALGPDGAKRFDPDRPGNAPGTGGDSTHLNPYGAQQTAPLIAEELKRLHHELASHLKNEAMPSASGEK